MRCYASHMNLMIVSGLALALFTQDSQAALTCEKIEAGQTEDSGIIYFTKIENFKIAPAVEKQIVRAAVADFYGTCGATRNDDYCYRPNLSFKDVVELGEGAFFIAYGTPSGQLYYAVNVGFGGGNSAVYYFKPGNLKMEKVMVVDGAECRPIQSIPGYDDSIERTSSGAR